MGSNDERINQIAENVAHMRGELDALIPHLATEAFIRKAISEHQQMCPHAISAKLIAKIAAAVIPAAVGLSAVVNQMLIALVN